MWELAEAIAGIGEACRALDTPITGGNVSLYNETLGRGIFPTPVLGVVGLLDLSRVPGPLAARFPAPGRAIVLLSGSPASSPHEFGSSEYAAFLLGKTWGTPPALDLAGEHALHRVLEQAHVHGWLDSAHQISSGGLAVALAECCLAHAVERAETVPLGLEVNLPGAGPAWLDLFGEAASRVVVSCDAARVAELMALARGAGLEAITLGETRERGFVIRQAGEMVMQLELEALAQAWRGGLA
jgi:phosphoribosylformylglycinamidine synthase